MVKSHPPGLHWDFSRGPPWGTPTRFDLMPFLKKMPGAAGSQRDHGALVFEKSKTPIYHHHLEDFPIFLRK
jgi:hypothetical protein